jgi:hypothetical protein
MATKHNKGQVTGWQGTVNFGQQKKRFQPLMEKKRQYFVNLRV